MTPTPEVHPPRTRVVIYNERDFSPLTVTLLPFEFMEAMWRSEATVQMAVTQPSRMPRLGSDYEPGLTMQLHFVVLRGMKIRLAPDRQMPMPHERTMLMVLTSTPRTALWLPPVQLPGQGPSEADQAREAFEAGQRDGELHRRR